MYSWKSGVSEWPGSVVVLFCSPQGDRGHEKWAKTKVLSGKSWGTAVGNRRVGGGNHGNSRDERGAANQHCAARSLPRGRELGGALPPHRDAHEGTTVFRWCCMSTIRRKVPRPADAAPWREQHPAVWWPYTVQPRVATAVGRGCDNWERGRVHSCPRMIWTKMKRSMPSKVIPVA